MISDETSLQNYLPQQEYFEAKAEKLRRLANLPPPWPENYVNSSTGKIYQPHHEDEANWIADIDHRYLLAKGGEGGGKSVAGIIRNLNRIRYGAHGIMVSPDFEHFKKSLWPEFRRWCPWDRVVPQQRYRASFDWEPSKPFQLAFDRGAIIYCGGMKETEVMAWEGPNVNWAHFDEPRRHKTAAALKVLDGRVRIPVAGFPPQIWYTTTPRKHWLFEFFGPEIENDPRADFKHDALVMTLLTVDNEMNLSPDFVRQRRQTLTEAEARVLLEAEWEDIEDADRFLPSMIWWDNLKAAIPAPTKAEPMVVAVDAAVGRQTGYSDCFGLVGVTRHIDEKYRHNQLFVRYVRKWQARPGKKINFDEPREELRKLCREFNVVMLAYDNHQLHDMMSGLAKENIVWTFEFSQQTRRLQSDRQLLDLILEQRIWHDGNIDLREHIDNADKKFTDDGRRFRIVKREETLKNDLAVSLSMAAYECLRLNL